MEVSLWNDCFFSFASFIVFVGSASSLQLSDCKEFKVIPPEQYDRNVSSLTDITKRPLGYMYAKADYPTVQSEVKNPCFYVRNLTSRNVEVMIQTRVSGKTVCVRDNKKPTPKTDCAQGGTLSLACWDPTTNDVIFEFYCDPGKGCDTDVQFWFRLTPSPPGADVDDWCLARNSLFPHDLKEVPIPRDKEPTVKSSTTSFSSCNFLLGGICLLMLHWFAHSLEN
ncbi:unnamed protein product [Pocillopora meandrina]|uniref:Uncharacterized protein n=1 Tax=Pocillopora meandrina TaxID=46732 RepID=A0AAU9X3T2_9CNID|nr:unnamed protein product [Pocillopora meandrina]